MQIESRIAAFGGLILKLSHESKAVQTKMRLNLFLPPNVLDPADPTKPTEPRAVTGGPTSNESGASADHSLDPPPTAPVLFYLAGLTCNENNGLEKGGFLGPAAKHGLALVFPDTSPRTTTELVGASGLKEHERWDFGSGAGFYLDATAAPWNEHYRMETYIVDELPELLGAEFACLDFGRMSLMGHSMGGHGALTLFMRNPQRFASASAFAPIVHPQVSPWGQRAFSEYLGGVEHGAEYDTAVLLAKALDSGSSGYLGSTGAGGAAPMILVDQGLGDKFLEQGELRPEFLEVGEGLTRGIVLRRHVGYDHSYFFVSTFAEDHIKHHAVHLQPPAPPY